MPFPESTTDREIRHWARQLLEAECERRARAGEKRTEITDAHVDDFTHRVGKMADELLLHGSSEPARKTRGLDARLLDERSLRDYEKAGVPLWYPPGHQKSSGR